MRVGVDATEAYYRMRSAVTLHDPDAWDRSVTRRGINFGKLAAEFGVALPDGYPQKAAFDAVADAAMRMR